MRKGFNRNKSILFIFIGIAGLVASNFVDELRVYQGAQIATYIVAISSLILLTGYSGQVSLGHGAFLAIGGYAAAVAKNNFHLPTPVTFLVAAVFAAIAGAILGVAAARLSGPYLAGTTLALALGIPSIANQFSILGGEQGLLYDVGLPPKFLGDNFTQYKWFFWISLTLALVSMWLLQNLLRSRYGRTWRAIRINRIASELIGINAARKQILAFTISAAIAGLSGSVLVMTISTVSPSAFPLALSFSLLTGAVISGIATLPGVVLGSFTLVVIPEIADAITSRTTFSEAVVANLPGFIISGLLVLTVLFAPNGPLDKPHKKGHRDRDKSGQNS